MEVGLCPGHIVLDRDLLPHGKGHSSPSPFLVHVYCGQTVAHFSYCWALVLRFETFFTRATVAIARVLAVVVSVCPPVCHSVLLKGPNVGLRKLCTVAQWLQFSDAKYLGKIQTPSVTPNGGAKRKLGVIKIGDFRQITHYNSKTVEDRHIVLFKSIRKS